jgi:peptide/nickel transport system substrate-binding protein
LRSTRRSAFAAAVAVSALVLTACSGNDGAEGGAEGDDNAGISQETTVNVGWNQPFYSYNQDSITGNATANSVITYLMKGSFNYYDDDLNLVKDESFGTYEVTSEDPLTVEYRFAENARWSDGVPLTPADLLLEWAAHSAKFNNVEPVLDEEGNVTNQAEIDAGIYFDAGTPGIMLVEETPTIEDDTFTMVWSKPFADWEVAMTGPSVPAHVVGQRALDIEDPEEATQAVVDAIQNEDPEALAALSKVWSTDFNYTDLPEDEGLRLSNGAYIMTALEADQFVTLEENPEYEGDRGANIKEVTVRWNGDPMGQAQALQNGELDLISPQATADLLTALEGMEGMEVLSADEGTYEHVDLQFTNGGPFDPATYGGNADTAKAVRQAFLSMIPRQQIVENLIKPLNPNAEVRQSYTQVPGSPLYEEIASSNGMAELYGEPDAAAAAQLLQGAGVTTPVNVRLLFDPNNPRRVNEYELIAASAREAGFEVVPYQVQADWGTDLSNATSFYDAALFGWQSESTAVTESEATYKTGGLNNYYGYSNPQVDALYDELQTETDPARQDELQVEIEKLIVQDAFSVTIFQFPGVTAWNPERISNVSKIPINPTIFAGYPGWEPGTAAAAE